jgi:hypothetical protein
MTTYDPEDQVERRRVLINDARARDHSRNGDTSSYINHYSPEMGGRFSNVGAATVVGQSPNPYPPLPENNPWRSDPVPPEPPLGYRIDAMPEPECSAQPSLASSMYPALSRQAKAQDAERERRKQSLLRNLRELNAKIDERMRREGR